LGYLDQDVCVLVVFEDVKKWNIASKIKR